MANALVEVWKDIAGYEEFYQVSNLGNIRSKDRVCIGSHNSRYILPGRIMNKVDNGTGYDYITLHKDGKRKNFYVHRLVAETFLEKIPGKTDVNHIDYNRKNNSVDNLEWCTRSENIRHSILHMKGPKSKCQSNTGERYIHQRGVNSYEVVVNRKYLGKYQFLEDAIRERDKYINEICYY